MNQALSISRYIGLSCTTRFPPVVNKLADFFGGRNDETAEAYLVGGDVRDALLGYDAEDIDIAIAGDAYSVGRDLAGVLGGCCVPLHDDFQVARVLLQDGDFNANIDIATIQGGIERDLLRRDFTINAIALPIDAALCDDVESRLLDPCGGLQDLQDGIVRMVSPEALDEDCVRLMRGARLAVQFGFSLEPETADAIGKRASRISAASQERVRDELMRLLQTPNARDGLRLLDDLGLLCAIMPELAQAKGVEQPKEHYWDVFNHLIEAVGWVEVMFNNQENCVYPLDIIPRFEGMGKYFCSSVSDGFDRLAYLKLAALLHDIAKPVTKTTEASGRIRFLGHHTEGAEIARNVLTRLRFGNKGVEHVAAMVRHHLRPGQMAQKGEMPTKRALYRYYRDVGDVALDTLYLNTADYLSARGLALKREDWTKYYDLIRYILEEGRNEEGGRRRDSVKSLPKLVDGYDIIDRFALVPGPRIGILLEEVREAQASGEVSTREQALELVRTSLERGGNGA